MNINESVLKQAIKKAKSSGCRYKISAIGFNSTGDFLGVSCNQNWHNKQGMSIHAEIALLKRFKKSLKTVIICRVNNIGQLLPIHPCNTCKKILTKYGIEIKTILEL